MKQKYYLALTTEEWRLMIEVLNNLRNRLIWENRYTDAVDEEKRYPADQYAYFRKHRAEYRDI